MASPPIYSRQPPDGHEFPDYEERQHSSTDRDPLDSLDSIEMPQEQESIPSDQEAAPELPSTQVPSLPIRSSFADIELRSEVIREDVSEPVKLNGQRSSLDVNLFNATLKTPTVADVVSDIFAAPKIHGRSQSLVDVSKPDRWSQIAEQRQRGLSKLKGLVIPENVPSEPCHVYDLPEITSTKLPEYQTILNQKSVTPVTKTVPSHRASLNLPSPIWKQQEANISTLPKYSPAFKRRSLQLYTNGQRPTVKPTPERFSTGFIYPETTSNEDGASSERNSSLPSLNDSDNDSAFKSCESLHSLEYNNTTQKEIETVNKRNSQPVQASAAVIFQTKCNMFEQQNNHDSKPRVRIPKVHCNDYRKFNEKLLKTKGVAQKIEASNNLDLNSFINAISINRTVPKSMQSKPVASVNDLRKKFQTPDAIPVVKSNSAKMTPAEPPASTKPSAIPSRFSNPVKLEDNLPAALPIKQQPDPPQLNTQDAQSAIAMILPEFGENIRTGDCFVTILKPEIDGGSLGLILAGGTDYESKEITVYSIRPGSVASKEAKLKRGDQILSINGTVMKNLTHAATTALLKGPKSEFEIVYCSRNEPISPVIITPKRNSRSFDVPPTNATDLLDTPVANVTSPSDSPPAGELAKTSSQSSIDVTIVKTSAGLGFSIAGGADSPTGDLPLIVKKVFSGGAAEKSGMLRANDELLTIGDVNVKTMSRLDVWTMMKKLPEGPVSLTVRR